MPKLKSQGIYFNLLENDFLLIPNSNTLIGKYEKVFLQIEKITKNKIQTTIDSKKIPVTSMVFNHSLNSLLIGDLNGFASQFKQDSSGNLQMEKSYGNVGVGFILAIDCIGNIAVVGGMYGVIRLIDMENQEVIGKAGTPSAMGKIFSLQFCRISKTKVHLAVGGVNNDYSLSLIHI